MRKKKEPTLTEQAIAAVDRVTGEILELRNEADMATDHLRKAVNWLSDINQDLGTKSALCGTLIAQLTRAQGDISAQCERNDTVKSALLDILMREKQ